MNLVYNSDVLSVASFGVQSTNRAFQYGDGLFETIRYEGGKLWFWPDHVDRLTRGMAALQLAPAVPFNTDELRATLLDLVQQNGLANGPARLKLQVWRQPGGLYTPTTHTADWLLTAQPTEPFGITSKARLGIFRDVRLSPSSISPFKTLNALPYVLAGLFRQQHHYDEALLLDTHGHIAECVASSIFWVKAHQLFTPSLETGCIDGIVRRQIMRNHPVQEGLFLPEVLADADAVFCANVNGIQALLDTPIEAVRQFSV
ncbi:aminotransferase class IV [Fibrella sp. HMF5335]|uniref:branched-chain-amino-acid transaminase n=1 Tax=Fibrella rubiginis TaxID=2817060 RepID=A0A939K2W3_9BACT|nr:aminotransferase class IV [Fibrella rubiginis]MBO0935003.1 aminotransferase class IV [Fibrella rubiginis]